MLPWFLVDPGARTSHCGRIPIWPGGFTRDAVVHLRASEQEIHIDYPFRIIASHRPAMLGLVALLGATLAGGSPAEARRSHLDKDSATCADFGAHQGSRDYSQCMLVQQQRRDDKMMNFMEQQRIASELTRNGLDLRDRVRAERERKRERKEKERHEAHSPN